MVGFACDMASGIPPPHDKKRVKVYELRNSDWFDRGTGFCTGRVVNVSIEWTHCLGGSEANADVMEGGLARC